MKKILFIVTQSEFGGAQRYIFEVAGNLDRAQYEVSAGAGQGDGELFKKLQDIGIRTIHLEQMKRAPWPWQIILAVEEMYALLKKEKPDVLFLCSTTAGLLGSIAGVLYRFFEVRPPKEVGPRIVYRIGGWAFRDPRAFWKNWLVLIAEKLTAPLKDKIIVNSEIDRKLALKYRIAPEKKLAKIYNGVDLNSLSFLSREEARKSLQRTVLCKLETVLVGTVANFYRTKGLEYLIEAARMLNFQFIIIGEGDLRPGLENLIKKYGLENKVILAGRIPNAYQYLKAFDIFVLPSLKEGFPWIILEAIGAEIPIVATKVGALPEILKQDSLVKPGNSQELAKKISWMVKHPAKVKLKPEFTSQKMIGETEKLLS